jgi:MFS family permease
VITAVMLASTAIAAMLGFLAAIPFPLLVMLCLLYGATVTGDSASITAGVVAVAPAGHRGATMAVHACLGFVGSSLGPLIFGVVLDASGGGLSPTSWGLAFLAMGAVAAIGPVGLAMLGRQRS